MGYLRLVRTGVATRAAGKDCLDAFDRELDYLFATLQRFGASPGEIDDLLQEIFIILYRRWPTLDTARSLRPWLFGVTFRVVRAHRRRRTREVLRDEVAPEDPRPSAEVELEALESLALLSTALERVPALRRTVVVMHDLDGLSVADIAGLLAMTKIGVYTRLYKGRRELASAVRRLARVAR
jgi:RNA polymerase sigma-70 factor (ECF subfamily)